ncbi:uncharacterized protein [Nicotiana tomentosiformis]|uniref:uncharacterized protein n=1 Tax=Nicotiana tomentosiformis TaxID=4098 RepID=UPI00388CE690
MGSNTVVGALFQERTSYVRPPYFNGQHFSHWKIRMETYIMSYNIKVWRVIKKENLPILLKKDENGQVVVSTDPLDLDDYTDEQSCYHNCECQKKNLLYNAIGGEEYEKISSCETAKEMWDKLEVTYEGTNKVKETRINLLVRDYELFHIKDGESVEEMFSRFSKILGDLKSLGRPIKSGEQVRKILRSLPIIWQPKVIALECQDLNKISYDELIGDLIAFDTTHLDRKIQQEKKKTVAFKATVAEPENEEKGGEQDENIAMLSQVVTSMMRKNRNSKRAYCPELKKKLSRNLRKKKPFKAWSGEEESDHEKIADMCFMAIKEDSNKDSSELGLMADEGADEEGDSDIERTLNKLRKIQREKNDWALKLEVCEIEHDMLQDEVNELQLNGSRTTGDGSGDLSPLVKLTFRNLTIQDSSRLGYLKTNEVYLVDELGYNLLSISQLCDNDYEVRFKKHGWFIENESGKVILSGNRTKIFILSVT